MLGTIIAQCWALNIGAKGGILRNLLYRNPVRRSTAVLEALLCRQVVPDRLTQQNSSHKNETAPACCILRACPRCILVTTPSLSTKGLVIYLYCKSRVYCCSLVIQHIVLDLYVAA